LTTPSKPAQTAPGFLDSVRFAFTSRRTASVIFLYFSSGLPLGLIWYCIPDFMASAGVDIRIVGLTTLAHAPWTFKMLWSPLMDRYPLRWLGRRRGWIAVTQIALFAVTLLLAGVGGNPETPWVILALALAIAFASASQDIVIDAYAVDVLRPEEHGVANGARIAVYRVAMQWVSTIAITMTAWVSWQAVCGVLAVLYLPMLWLTVRAPEPPEAPATPGSLRDAIWLPFLGFLSRHRALEILAFVLLYKLADNLSQSLLRPFLVDMGYNEIDRGVALGTVGLFCTLIGTFLGGILTTGIGLGHSLWIFGFLQIFSNLGYILIVWTDVNRPLMYGAMGFETFTTGLGMGAFGALLLRLTQKRFSATQYALFSSLFALPRLIAGPTTGYFVHALGWEAFFWLTMVAGIPGLLLLARLVPPGTREPTFTVEPPRGGPPISTAGLVFRGAIAAALGLGLAFVVAAAGAAGEASFSERLWALFQPDGAQDYLVLLGSAIFAAACGLLTAAVVAARRGSGMETER